jgi:phosphopantothenoylcysteine decarboxylase/phosphopantothenate--cysteine ligase
VILISGPTALADPERVTVIRVRTAEEMFNAVMAHADEITVVVKAAAVSDWRPAHVFQEKVKKGDMEPHFALEQTRDILGALGENKKEKVVVGFAAETQHLEENAQAKLAEKNLDLIVGNLIGDGSSGFGSNKNKVSFFYKDGRSEDLPVMDKAALADILLDRVLEVRRHLIPDP